MAISEDAIPEEALMVANCQKARFRHPVEEVDESCIPLPKIVQTSHAANRSESRAEKKPSTHK